MGNRMLAGFVVIEGRGSWDAGRSERKLSQVYLGRQRVMSLDVANPVEGAVEVPLYPSILRVKTLFNPWTGDGGVLASQPS